jgi:hypothetical protein
VKKTKANKTPAHHHQKQVSEQHVESHLCRNKTTPQDNNIHFLLLFSINNRDLFLIALEAEKAPADKMSGEACPLHQSWHLTLCPHKVERHLSKSTCICTLAHGKRTEWLQH